jgi:hypothetical protein
MTSHNGCMLDIKKALTYLRGELSQVNRMIGVFEAIAEKKYEKRVKLASNKAVAPPQSSVNKQPTDAFIPPRTLDPDATLWLH